MKFRLPCATTVAFGALFLLTARAGDLDFSDPAKVQPPPAHAIGFPSRDPKLDARPSFQNPPPGYGEVGFYWWLGDPLTKERLTWQLDQLAGKGVAGLQINYAHSDRGGRSYGLTYPSEPALFSEDWWKLTSWFMQEAKKRDMAVSLSDYTLGVGQGWCMDEVLREHPEVNGTVLQHEAKEVAAGDVQMNLRGTPLMVAAYNATTGAAVDLRPQVSAGVLKWRAPEGRWRIVAVYPQPVVPSYDPMNPLSGPEYAKKFFGRWEEHNPGEGGQGLNFFFSDELDFGVHGQLWNERFADEFRRRKGYDVVPELPALFADIGPRTPKVRLDYRDVMVSLTEEGFFRPLFEWHQSRGMIYGCDHGGRGRNVVEFGDYFRTQRWMNGTGNDQPNLSSDLIKTKVNSSIVHLYQRARVWLEGYYGSGWGTSSEQLADATFRNFAHGHTLLTFHGLYYSTHGGWWEWAPPCNHFRMPYWTHMGEFLKCSTRLSYLLSQGVHRCDVAILYPVAAMEADLDGNRAVQTAFDAGQHLYGQGIDFDYMDFESLARAEVEEKELRVSGERYRVLILPATRAVRWSTIQKALEFQRAGGLVLALGALPEASDRAGRDDAELNTAVKTLFGDGKNVLKSPAEAAALITGAFPRDFVAVGQPKSSPQFLHRQIGARDVFMVYGAAKDSEFAFRAAGQVELWDPWTGNFHPVRAVSQEGGVTKLRLPLTEKEAQLIVFSPGHAELEPATPAAAPSVVPLDGPWEFELKPTMDNRFGDFRWPPAPALIGAEARRFLYADETKPNPGWQDPAFDDSKWSKSTASFGPKFWKLGPLPDQANTAALEAQLAQLQQVDPAAPVEVAGKPYRWQPYSFSWRYGMENDPGHQGYHGLKEEVLDEFIGLGKRRESGTGTSYEKEDGGSRYYLWTSVAAASATPASAVAGGFKPAAVWLNHSRLAKATGKVQLNSGANPLLLRYDAPGRGYFVVQTGETGASSAAQTEPFSPAAFWIWTTSEDRGVVDRCFRKVFHIEKLPALAALRITCDNGYTVFVNGKEVGRGSRWETVQEYDVTKRLQTGANVIAVLAHNDGADGGLIAELATPEGKSLLATDATWLFANKEEQGWRDANFDAGRWTKAWSVSNFEDSLWAKHPQGLPRVDAPLPAESTTKPGSLAMSWHNKPGLRPFDTRPQDTKPAGWYRFTSPPGLRGLTFATRGQVQAWANGKELSLTAGPPRTDGTVEFKALVPQPAAAPVIVALRIEQERGAYAGSALPEPITLDCGPGQTLLGDWTKQGALECYSGGAWYRKTVALTPEQARGRVTLDLGNLASSTEVRVNGRPAGIRVAPPWRFDVTDLVKPGDNRVEVLVYSALGGHYTTIPTRYHGLLTSGLLGPVVISSNKQ